MALERLRIELSANHPRGKIIDLDTGEEVQNVTALSVHADVDARPVVTITLHVVDVVIETDGTIPPDIVRVTPPH